MNVAMKSPADRQFGPTGQVSHRVFVAESSHAHSHQIAADDKSDTCDSLDRFDLGTTRPPPNSNVLAHRRNSEQSLLFKEVHSEANQLLCSRHSNSGCSKISQLNNSDGERRQRSGNSGNQTCSNTQSKTTLDPFLVETTDIVLGFLQNRIEHGAKLPFPRCSMVELNQSFVTYQRNREVTPAAKVLVAAVDFMERQQGPMLNHLVSRLPINSKLPETFEKIAHHLFFNVEQERSFRWSDLIALFAFTGRIAVNCVKVEAGAHVWQLALIMTDLLVKNLRSYIELRGGWNDFVTYYNGMTNNQASSDSEPSSSRLRRFWSQVAHVAGLCTEGTDSQSSDGQVSPSVLSKVCWFAPIAIGAGVLFNALSRT